MANPFDAFDEEVAVADQPQANPFDQFDKFNAYPDLEPQGSLGSFWTGIKSKAIPGIVSAVGAGAGGALGAGAGPVGAVAAGLAGAEAGGAAGEKLQQSIFGKEAMEREAAQIELNKMFGHELAAGAGEMLPAFASPAGFEKGIAKGAVAGAEQIAKKTLGQKALEGVEHAAKSGLIMGGASEGERQAKEGKLDAMGLVTHPLEEAVKFAPVGLVPGFSVAPKMLEGLAGKVMEKEAANTFGTTAGQILGGIGKAAPDAAVMTLTGNLYDHFVHDKPLSFANITDETGQSIPSFMLLNGLMGLIHAPGMMGKINEARQQAGKPPLSIDEYTAANAENFEASKVTQADLAGQQKMAEVQTAADAAREASSPATAEVLEGKAIDAASEAANQVLEQPNPNVEEAKPAAESPEVPPVDAKEAEAEVSAFDRADEAPSGTGTEGAGVSKPTEYRVTDPEDGQLVQGPNRFIVTKNASVGKATEHQTDPLAESMGASKTGEPQGEFRVSVFQGDDPLSHESFKSMEEADAYAKKRHSQLQHQEAPVRTETPPAAPEAKGAPEPPKEKPTQPEQAKSPREESKWWEDALRNAKTPQERRQVMEYANRQRSSIVQAEGKAASEFADKYNINGHPKSASKQTLEYLDRFDRKKTDEGRQNAVDAIAGFAKLGDEHAVAALDHIKSINGMEPSKPKEIEKPQSTEEVKPPIKREQIEVKPPAQEANALPKQQPAEVLPREQGKAPEAGGERGGVGQGKQGAEAPGAQAPSSAEAEATVGKGNVREMNGIARELTPEQAKEFDRLTEQGKSGKAAGMRASAEKRRLHPDWLTEKEKAAHDKRMAGFYHGKPILVDGKEAEVVQPVPGGKVKVKYPNGYTITVSKDRITTPEPRYMVSDETDGDSGSKTVSLWKAERKVGDIKDGPKLGEFLTNDEQSANSLADLRGKVEKVKATLKKPLQIAPKDGSEYIDHDEMNKILADAGIDFKVSEDFSGDEVWRIIDEEGKPLIKAIRKAGFDSIQFPEFLGGRDQTTTLLLDHERSGDHFKPKGEEPRYMVSESEIPKGTPASQKGIQVAREASGQEPLTKEETGEVKPAEYYRKKARDKSEKELRKLVLEDFWKDPSISGPQNNEFARRMVELLYHEKADLEDQLNSRTLTRAERRDLALKLELNSEDRKKADIVLYRMGSRWGEQGNLRQKEFQTEFSSEKVLERFRKAAGRETNTEKDKKDDAEVQKAKDQFLKNKGRIAKNGREILVDEVQNRGRAVRRIQVERATGKKQINDDYGPEEGKMSVDQVKDLLIKRFGMGGPKIKVVWDPKPKMIPDENRKLMPRKVSAWLENGIIHFNAEQIRSTDQLIDLVTTHELAHVAGKLPEAQANIELMAKVVANDKAMTKQLEAHLDKYRNPKTGEIDPGTEASEREAEIIRMLSKSAETKGTFEKIVQSIGKAFGIGKDRAFAEQIASQVISEAAKGFKPLGYVESPEAVQRFKVEGEADKPQLTEDGRVDEEAFNQALERKLFNETNQDAALEQAIVLASTMPGDFANNVHKMLKDTKAFEGFSKNDVIERMGEWMDTRFKTQSDLRRAKAAEIQKLKQLQKNSPEEAKALKRIENLKKRLETGNFVKETPAFKKYTDALWDLKLQEDEFRRKVWAMENERRRENRPFAQRVGDSASDAINFARSIMTGADLSAVLRQGIFPTLANPVRSLKAMPAMLKAFASSEFQREEMNRIRHRPNAPLYEEGNLFLKDPDETTPSAMEEAFMSRWIAKWPRALGGGVVRGSERAYVTFLNRLRADVFDSLASAMKKPHEEFTHEEIEALGNAANVLTGRGKIFGKKGAATGLNLLFFSPNYVASTFNTMFGQPFYHGSGATRKAIAGEYARFLGGAALIYTLASQLLGDEAEIETDPRSSDFGKIKLGNTRVNPIGGLIQNTTLLSRIATGETKTASGQIQPLRGDGVKYGGQTTTDVIGRYMRQKLSPIVSAGLNVAAGQDVVGQPTDLASEAGKLVYPLSMRDIQEVMEDQGVPRGTALSILSLFGMGVNSFDSNRPR